MEAETKGGEAIALWHTMGRETLFQAESPDTPIQILGPLESTGLTFDALWLLGLDDYNWPPAPQSNPLLPNRLQRVHRFIDCRAQQIIHAGINNEFRDPLD